MNANTKKLVGVSIFFWIVFGFVIFFTQTTQETMLRDALFSLGVLGIVGLSIFMIFKVAKK